MALPARVVLLAAAVGIALAVGLVWWMRNDLGPCEVEPEPPPVATSAPAPPTRASAPGSANAPASAPAEGAEDEWISLPDPRDPTAVVEVDFRPGVAGFLLGGRTITIEEIRAHEEAVRSTEAALVPGRGGRVSRDRVLAALAWKVSHVDGVHYADGLPVVAEALARGDGDGAVRLMERFRDAAALEAAVLRGSRAGVEHYDELVEVVRRAAASSSRAIADVVKKKTPSS